jgi:hypothetical protein
MADQHRSESATYLARLTADSDLDIIQKADSVMRSTGSAITRLRSSPRLDQPWQQFARELHRAAERVQALAERAASQYYEERIAEVTPVISEALSEGGSILTAAEFVGTRFRTQNAVLSHLEGHAMYALAGVRYDIDRRLAIPYFLIDLTLLRTLCA